MNRMWICLFVPAWGVLADFPGAYGEAIPIDNPGFEDPVLADDDWDYSRDNQGWGYFDNDGYLGSWDITTADYPGEAPEGQIKLDAIPEPGTLVMLLAGLVALGRRRR